MYFYKSSFFLLNDEGSVHGANQSSVKYCGFVIKGARLICEIMLSPAGLSRLVTRSSRFKDHCYANQNRVKRQHVVFTTIDLKDGYFTIPINPDHYKYMRFQCNSTLFEFICLPFGLCSAPRVFTEVLKPLDGSIRIKGISLVVYLDDMAIIRSSRELSSQGAAFVV